MRPTTINYDLETESLTGFASNVTAAAWTLTATSVADGTARRVSIRNDSAVDHSLKTALLTGKDENNNTQTETVNLPGASLTITSTKYFKTLSSVVPSATIGANTMDIGFVDELVTPAIMLNHYAQRGVAFHVEVTGTINYTVQQTLDDLQDSAAVISWSNHDSAALVGATTSKNGSYEYIPRAMRVLVNSHSAGAEIKLNVIQA